MEAETGANQVKQTRTRVPQTEFPNITLESALRLPVAIWENYAGKGASPINVALALEMKPSSGGWRNLCGSSIAYGLSDGGYNASEIALTSLGLRIVRPTVEGDDLAAKREAILKPRIQREFLEKYDGAKFPKDLIAKNVLVEMGLPKDRSDQALDILKKNGQFAGVLVEIKGESYVSLASERRSNNNSSGQSGVDDFEDDLLTPIETFERPEEPSPDTGGVDSQRTESVTADAIHHVFITHGRNTKILSQIEKIVRYGGFEPVIAKDHETPAKPVPDKVLHDMRACQAAVIHVGSEGTLRDQDDNLISKINGNVLIEIGIARALYDYNFILLVEDGLELPSNLQGLYECRYQGDELNMDATMKILEAFNEFKKTGKLR